MCACTRKTLHPIQLNRAMCSPSQLRKLRHPAKTSATINILVLHRRNRRAAIFMLGAPHHSIRVISIRHDLVLLLRQVLLVL